MIELQRVSKTYNAGKPNAFTALRGIDLDMRPGETTVFKGPSGSGKTTLLSITGCMCRPTSGRIWLNSVETTSLPERFGAEIRRKTFGFIFQSFNLIRGITVLENVMIPGYPLGVRHGVLKQRAGELLGRLQILDKAHQKVECLSGGEMQRVAIARALINDPPIVIADEPTAHLDTNLTGALMETLAGLKKDGKTILIASHDPLVFESPVVDRIVTLRDGAVIDAGGEPA